MSKSNLNGYFHVRVMYPTGPGIWAGADLWQEVRDGKLVRLVTLDGVEVTVPDVHEAVPISRDCHFAPGVLLDPEGYQPPSIAEFQSAAAKGMDSPEYLAWVQEQQDRAAAARKREPPVVEPTATATLEQLTGEPLAPPVNPHLEG